MKVIDTKRNRVTCEMCDSILEYETEDIKTGEYGSAYVICPVCGCHIYIDDEKLSKKITAENVEFPKDFWEATSSNSVDVSNETIVSWIKNACNSIDNGESCYFTSSGNALVFAIKDDDAKLVVVTKEYYETYIY